ncbi:MAG TPA: glucose-1-phosphate adenylyltransferase [Vicinamibacterales bacterium]|jgi:glucose-1-phosphate adenylyltransferase
MMKHVLALILGGGRGARLFPLTHLRSKPAVPIAGKYRLIDVPISNCLHADIRRIYVLTQFNSASLNRHIAETYRMDLFSRGFVEILAAEQTPDNPNWFQGTADAVRQAARHFIYHDAEYYLILAGDHLYRMDYAAMIEEHVERRADVTIAAQPITSDDAPAMGIFRFDTNGQIVGFEEKPNAERLRAIGASVPSGSRFLAPSADKPFIASMGIYVFTRDVLLDALERHPGVDFGHEIIPAALDNRRVNAYLFRDYWQDVGTVPSFYDANIMLTRPRAPFNFYDPRRPVFTRPRFLPGSRLNHCTVNEAVVAEGCYMDQCTVEQSVVGIRTRVGRNCEITRSVLLGADFYEKDDDAPLHDGGPELGIGADSVLDRVIVDKNARIGAGVRLTNEAGVQQADGAGYYIRNGIIIVPKWGVVPAGTVA